MWRWRIFCGFFYFYLFWTRVTCAAFRNTLTFRNFLFELIKTSRRWRWMCCRWIDAGRFVIFRFNCRFHRTMIQWLINESAYELVYDFRLVFPTAVSNFIATLSTRNVSVSVSSGHWFESDCEMYLFLFFCVMLPKQHRMYCPWKILLSLFSYSISNSFVYMHWWNANSVGILHLR